MRKRKNVTKLGRDKAHREALLRNLSQDLIIYGKITTTLAKAKALRPFVEPLITKARRGDDYARQLIARVLYKKEAVNKLMTEIGPAFKGRNGGYTRIVKLGKRQGDGAEEAIVQIVDYDKKSAEDKSKAKST